MKNIILILLTTFLTPHALDLFNITEFDSSEIPSTIRPKGKIVKTAKWHDKSGIHYIIISEYNNKEICTKGFKSEFYARQFTKKDSFVVDWKIQDFSTNQCEKIYYLDTSFAVFDIDNDGIAETRFFYEFGHDCCDPLAVKYMLHYNNNKLAIRGKIPMTEESKNDYIKKIDKAYDKYPEVIKEFAIKDWDNFINNVYDVFK